MLKKLFANSYRRSVLALAACIASLAVAPAALAAPETGPKVHSIMVVDQPLRPGEYLWEPQRAHGGRIEIVIDLASDQMYVYRGGVEIGRSLIIFGDGNKQTPLGSFTILQKDIDHVSNIYKGAPMPYMLRLTWGGISIHGSGETVDGRWATHGCIGLPDEFAALLYSVAKLGDRATVTRNWMPDAYGYWTQG